jgi:hypothetical protein
MAAVPGRLGNVEAIGRPVGTLVGPALYLDVKRGPPLLVVRGHSVVAVPGPAGREIVEAALGVQGGERAGQVLGVLGLQMAADQVGEGFVHGQPHVVRVLISL